MLHRARLCGLLLFGLLPAVTSGSTWIVDQGGGGDFTTIQAAIAASATGDEIVVHPGTYLENINYLSKDLDVHGSAGAEATTIDGSAGSPGLGSCVNFSGGQTRAAILEGFTLTGGHGTLYGARLDDLPRDTMVGGAIYCAASDPRITQCILRENRTTYAAGIFLDAADPEIDACTFETNHADTYGGGVAGPTSAPFIHDCVFEGNCAGDGDGTIHLAQAAVIERCTFRNNEARAGGAINAPSYGANLQVRDCIFEGNASHGTHGGAIRVHEASPIIERCLFVGNHAIEDGGAILCIDGGMAQILSCTFWGNGAARNGGAIAVWSYAQPILRNNIIAGTTSAGGVFTAEGTPAFLCNDAWDNTGGNYVGGPDPTGSDGNIALDPRFCDPEHDDFLLGSDSPCAEENNPDCGQIGLYPVGCGPSPAWETSWGALKSMFRLANR